MDEEEYCYCHNDLEDESIDCWDYLDCEGCPYYYGYNDDD